jgi:hypothetical protein
MKIGIIPAKDSKIPGKNKKENARASFVYLGINRSHFSV